MAAILPGRATPRPPEDCVNNRIGRAGRDGETARYVEAVRGLEEFLAELRGRSVCLSAGVSVDSN
jgi:hypothetical protein